MGILDIFKKQERETCQNMSTENFREDIVETYKSFYERNKDIGEPVYGLIPLGSKEDYPCYFRENFETNMTCDFLFDEACIWEEIQSRKLADKKSEDTKYGNIPMANLGCGTFFTLICSGKHAGEVWLLTSMGITPIRENFGLENFEIALKEEEPNFWYPAIKNWGPCEYAFLASHAIPKIIITYEKKKMEIEPLGVSSNLCESCMRFVRATAMRHNQDIVISDSFATRVFYANGDMERV